MTTILMVSGSWPPQPCGVGDYAARLADALVRKGVDVIRFARPRFGLLYSPAIVADVARQECDLVHIQYPAAGYGRALTPSLIARGTRKPVVVTLHEYTVFKRYRSPWFTPFARDCRARIFTVGFERDRFEARYPRRRGFDITIEIASNVPRGRPVARRADKLVYFGLIAPQKGIEAFLELAAVAKARSCPMALMLIGAVPARHRAYADDIICRARKLDIGVRTDLSSEGVADELAGATFAYLPFPDGASAKRGSLAAALVNGLAVVTTHGLHTPAWMRQATLDADCPLRAFEIMMSMRRDPAELRKVMDSALAAARRLSWESIADRHAALYADVLGRPVVPAARTIRDSGAELHQSKQQVEERA
jgi:glycosyltransferase involved in cell wall biosynthesis